MSDADWIYRLSIEAAIKAKKLNGGRQLDRADLETAMRLALKDYQFWEMCLGKQVICPRCEAAVGEWCSPGMSICGGREYLARELRGKR